MKTFHFEPDYENAYKELLEAYLAMSALYLALCGTVEAEAYWVDRGLDAMRLADTALIALIRSNKTN